MRYFYTIIIIDMYRYIFLYLINRGSVTLIKGMFDFADPMRNKLESYDDTCNIKISWMQPASRGGEEPPSTNPEVNNTDYASPRPLATLHDRRRSRYRRQRVIRVRSENPFSNGISSPRGGQKARQEIVGYVAPGRRAPGKRGMISRGMEGPRW